MTRHAYLPTLIKTDKGSVLVSQVIHEVAEILGINLKHAKTKHSQTIGVQERAHATIKNCLKMASGEYRKQWQKYLPIAVLNYNTTYHSRIDCKPSRVFHGRVSYSVLDHKLGLPFLPISHLLQSLHKNYSAETKPYTIKPRKMSRSRTSNTRDNTTKKQKLHL